MINETVRPRVPKQHNDYETTSDGDPDRQGFTETQHKQTNSNRKHPCEDSAQERP